VCFRVYVYTFAHIGYLLTYTFCLLHTYTHKHTLTHTHTHAHTHTHTHRRFNLWMKTLNASWVLLVRVSLCYSALQCVTVRQVCCSVLRHQAPFGCCCYVIRVKCLIYMFDMTDSYCDMTRSHMQHMSVSMLVSVSVSMSTNMSISVSVSVSASVLVSVSGSVCVYVRVCMRIMKYGPPCSML